MEEETNYKFDPTDYLQKLQKDGGFFRKVEGVSDTGNEKVDYEELTIKKVWVTQAWSSYQMHADIDDGGGHETWDRTITKNQYKNFYDYKDDTRRLSLFLKVFGDTIIKRKIVATKHIDVRVTPKLYNQLTEGAKVSKRTLSDYCRELLKDKVPRAALSDKEQQMMEAVANAYLDVKNYRAALIAELKGMTKEERLHYMIEGESLSWYRQYINKTISIVNDLIKKN